MKNLTTTLILILGFLPFSLLAQDFWEQLPFPDSVHIQCIATNSQGHIFVGTLTQNKPDEYIYRSIDEGQSWEIVKELQYGSVLAIDINENDEIFVGLNTMPNLMLSQNNGDTWQDIDLEYDYYGNIVDVKCVGIDTIYFSSYSGPHFYKSFDGGQNWTHTIINDTTSEYITDITVLENNDIYVSCNAYFHNNGGVYKSSNYGDQWEFVGLRDHQLLCIETNSNDDIFTGDWWVLNYDEDIGIYALFNGNTSFNYILNGGSLTDIAINSLDHIYVALSEIVIFSEDNGQNFEMLPNDFGYNKSKLHFDDNDFLYAAQGENLFRSIKSTITAVNEQQITNKPNISPNPCQNELKISFNNNPVGNEKIIVNIYSITGELMRNLAITTNSGQCNIATDQLKCGVYFLHIVSSNNNFIEKFIKQ